MKKASLAFAISAALSPGVLMAQQAIDLSSLNGANGFVVNGIDAGDYSGRRVAGAGDINGDGVADVVVSASGASPGTQSEGETYVIFGSRTGFSASISLANLDGSNGFVLNGVDANDASGRDVSGAGDVNGDGVDDLIIGAVYADPGADEAGEAYIVFGGTTAFPADFDLSSLDGSNGFVLTGTDMGDLAGIAVDGAGDVNGDGIADVIIGAAGRGPGSNFQGVSYVVFGSRSAFPASIELASLNGSDGFALNGINAGDIAGISVSSAGDVNGDNIDDVLIGAPNADPGTNNEGETYVVFGSSEGFAAGINLADLDGSNGFTISGPDLGDNSGTSVSHAGDVNSDGIGDILIGAPLANPGGNNEGESYVVFGRETAFSARVSLASLNGSNGFVLNGVDAGAYTGFSVSSAGDVNGDGISDVIFGAPFADAQNSDDGETYLVFGRETGFGTSLNLSELSGPNGLVINGIDAMDFSGSVGAAGDVNGDGIDDVIIGAYSAGPSGNSAGESYVLFGNAAPMRAAGPNAVLFDQLEDDVNAPGSQLDLSLAQEYLDVDPFGGVAIIGDGSALSQGRWQSSPDGITWADLPSPLSDSSALVLGGGSSVRFVPAADFNGQPGALSVRLWDGRWRTPGAAVDITTATGALGGFAGNDNLLAVTVNITPVNDAPSLVAADPPAVTDTDGPQTVTGWATLSAGPADEAGQQVSVAVIGITNPNLFLVLPAVDADGNLTYTPAPGANGSSSFTVVAGDDGGVANGGQNTSPPQTFQITISSDVVFANSFE
ncbi:MAG: Ig-like domain-containing protein [Pseudomonadota bacterium]